MDSLGYIYKREVRKRTYHNEGYIDIVIKEGSLFIAIEAKMSGIGGAFSQACGNLLLCRYSYVLYPRIPVKQITLNNFQKVGIGLIIPHSKKAFSKFRVYLKPHISRWRMYMRNYMIRNWNQNRVGRILNPAEVPEGYDHRKLAPTYDWVGIKTRKSKNKRLEDFEK